MPSLSPVKCPNCGAVLSIVSDSDRVTCTFCDVTSFVNRDARAPKSLVHPTGAPIVHVRSRSGSGAVIAICVSLGVLIVGAVFAANVLQHGIGGLRQAALIGNSVLVDANGDGSDDVVVRGIYIGDEVMHLRAFDGSSGKNLWISEPLLKASEPEVIAAAPGVVLAISEALAVGLDAQTGKPRFRAGLPERVEAVCKQAENTVLLTKDDKFYSINTASGSLTAAGAVDGKSSREPYPRCFAAPSDHSGARGTTMRELRSDDLRRVEGMRVETILEFAGAPPYLMLGERAVGSRVPMVGARTADRVLWKSDAPAMEPLGAVEGTPKAASIANGRAYVAYVRVGERAIRVASFTLADGQRQWESELPVGGGPSLLDVVASDRHVFVFTTKGNDGALRSLSTTDGRLEWSVGG